MDTNELIARLEARDNAYWMRPVPIGAISDLQRDYNAAIAELKRLRDVANQLAELARHREDVICNRMEDLRRAHESRDVLINTLEVATNTLNKVSTDTVRLIRESIDRAARR